ncbi:MAG: SDR family NAD(P)-dependent oxidoreductase, partial [Bacteroidota bacterium]
ALKDGDTLIVSGGAKGVTAACLIELSKRRQLNIGILGRTELEPEPEYLAGKRTNAELKNAVFLKAKENNEPITPMDVNRVVSKILGNREITVNLEKLARNGAKVKYMSIDITNSEYVNKAVGELRNYFGSINAIVHAAGVLADKYIHEKTDAQYDKVFSTKIHGFMNLLQATSEDKLTHICCFSSVAARMGNVGQVDYAMANEVLNKVCQSEQNKRKETCLVKSINWGPWDGGMVSEQLKKHFNAMGVALIPVELGARMFADEMEDTSIENVEIVVSGALDSWGNNDDNTLKTHTLLIHRSNSEFLASHKIEGNIVVPIMMVNEWSMRLAELIYPHLKVTAVKNMKVFKGIELKNFDTVGDILTFNYSVEPLENSMVIHIKIENDTARLLYSVSVVLADHYDVSEKKKTYLENLNAWKTDKKGIYTHKLFHGPSFQVVERLEGISDMACKALLKTKYLTAGNHATIPSDMLLYDGGIQLAILAMDAWTGNNSSLPMGYESLRIYENMDTVDEIHCELVATKKGNTDSKWNIHFKNKDHKILAEITGLKMYMYQVNRNN